MGENLHIISLNCQGLGQKQKRERLQLWTKNQKCNILFMQESHFIEKNEKTINCEFDGKMLHSYGNTQSRGVSIFVKNNLKCKTIIEIKDNELE